MKFPFLVKKSVPDELPELITDTIEKNIDGDKGEAVDNFLKSEESKVEKNSDLDKEALVPEVKPVENSVEEGSAEDLPDALPVVGEEENVSQKISSDKSFFEDLEKEVNDEVEDLDKLEDWYKNKFLPGDIVSDMRNYWEGQKTDSILKILGKNLQDKISKKIQDLQILEKQWQGIYFDLIEKEEEIKKEEGELKEILAEFVKICKTKNGEKKKEKPTKKKNN